MSSGYTPRRGNPNVSQYVANLNTLPPSSESAPLPDDAIFSGDLDLSLFANTQFFDFDMGQPIVESNVKYDVEQETRARRENASRHNFGTGLKFADSYDLFDPYPNLDYPNVLDAATDFQTLDNPLLPEIADPTFGEGQVNHSTATDSSTAVPVSVALAPARKSSSSAKPSSPKVATHLPKKRRVSSSPPASGASALASLKSPASQSSSSPDGLGSSDESHNRLALEEDKRKRNTAASARFRQKKKLREQAVEHENKTMKDRIAELESERQQLRMENKWLKDLLTRKRDNIGDSPEDWTRRQEELLNSGPLSMEHDRPVKKDGPLLAPANN